MTYKTEGIVLRTYRWPRQARFYIVYTKELGKIKAVAAGAQKVKSKVAGHLQPFCISDIMFAKGRSVDRLAQARLIKPYKSLMNSYPLFLSASYILEVVERLTQEGVADFEVYNQIIEVFDLLSALDIWGQVDDPLVEEQANLIMRIFSWKLLIRFGYQPQLFRCTKCNEAIAPGPVRVSLISGGAVCQKCLHFCTDASGSKTRSGFIPALYTERNTLNSFKSNLVA